MPFGNLRIDRVLFLLIAVLLFTPAAGVNWMLDTSLAMDSVRIRTIPDQADVAFGGGAADDPVNLRGVDYSLAPEKPFEWFLRFNLTSFQGKTIQSAILKVSKCKLSSECSSQCRGAGKCSCPNFYVDAQNCGGGSIEEVYDSSSDDLQVYHVPNSWTNTWTFDDWAQTWRARQQSLCCSNGNIGPKTFSFATHLGSVAQVGDRGTAEVEVVEALGPPDPGCSGCYQVQDGMVSFRLMVGGTTSRFYVPAGGDPDYAPTLEVTYTTLETTTTTLTSSTSTTSTASSTSTTTSSTSSTSTSKTTSTSTTTSSTSPSSTSKTISTSTLTTSTTTITSPTTASTISTSTTTPTTAFTTSSFTTTITTTTTLTTATTFTPTSTTTSTSSTVATTISPTTTLSTIATTSTTSTSTRTTTIPTSIHTTLTTSSSTSSRSSTTSTTTIVIITTTSIKSTTSTTTLYVVDVSHEFSAGTSSLTRRLATEPTADPTTFFSSLSFKSSCQAAVLNVVGIPPRDVTIIRVSAEPEPEAPQLARVMARYRITVATPEEQVNMVAMLSTADFAHGFKQQIMSEQHEGFRVSQLDFVRLRTHVSEPAAEAHKLNRDVVGSALDVFTSQNLTYETLLLWVDSATPAVEVAIAKSLALPDVSSSEQRISVTAGAVVVLPTYAKARFDIHAQVPPVANIFADPDGSLYRNRSMAYFQVINSLGVSEEFQSLMVEELAASGVPELLGMRFTNVPVDVDGPVVSAEEEEVRASLPLAIILAIMMSAVSTTCLAICLLKRRAIIRCCAKKCGMSCKKPLMQERDEDDCTVKPFDDNQVRVCMCGKTLSLDVDSCPTCRNRNKSNVMEVNININVHSGSEAFSQLKNALDGFKDTRGNEGGKEGTGSRIASKFNQIFKSVRSSSREPSPNGDLPELVDEYIYRRKQDYTDRPRAAGAMKTHLDDADHDLGPPGELGVATWKANPALGRCKPSPASTRASEGGSLHSISSDSPQISDPSSSSPQRCRPETRRTSPGRGGATGDGMFEGEKEMEVIDVSDTESETSHTVLGRTSSKALRLPKGFECRTTLDSRSLPNWTSSRLFRRTMTSYVVAEEGSLPSDRINPLPEERPRTVQCQRRDAHRTDGSRTARRSSGSDAIEVVDVTDFDETC